MRSKRQTPCGRTSWHYILLCRHAPTVENKGLTAKKRLFSGRKRRRWVRQFAADEEGGRHCVAPVEGRDLPARGLTDVQFGIIRGDIEGNFFTLP